MATSSDDPMISKLMTISPLEQMTTFLESTALYFESTDEYAQWVASAAQLMFERPPMHQAFMQLLLKRLKDKAPPEELSFIDGLSQAYEQCKTEAEKLEFCHSLHETIRKKLDSLTAANHAGAKSATKKSSPEDLADGSDDSMSDKGNLAFSAVDPTAQTTSDPMNNRLKTLNDSFKTLEFSGTQLPTRNPSSKKPARTLTPQKSAGKKSISPSALPKPTSGLAGRRAIDDKQWPSIVKKVTNHLAPQGYKAKPEKKGTSFSSITPPPTGQLRMQRDNQNQLRMVSSLKPPKPDLLISAFYATGQRHALIAKSESAENTKRLWDASKQHDGMTIEFALSVLEQLQASTIKEHQDLVEEYMQTRNKASKPSSPTEPTAGSMPPVGPTTSDPKATPVSGNPTSPVNSTADPKAKPSDNTDKSDTKKHGMGRP